MGVLSRKKKRPVDPDEKLIEDIIRLNKALIADDAPLCEHCGRGPGDSETRFKAQDRILKALALKARKAKSAGSKFDLGEDSDP